MLSEVDQPPNGQTNSEIGMFLYTRLVLDYLSYNVFFSGEEVKRSVFELPPRLVEL
jgi:hypothetical protein